MYILLRLTYAAAAWYALVKAYRRKLIQSQQKKALRKLTTAPRYVKNATIARDLRIEPLKEYIHRLAQNSTAT